MPCRILNVLLLHRRKSLLIALIAGLVSLVASAFSATMPSARAMWVYETTALLESGPARADLFQFCKFRQITDLFLQAHFVSPKKNGTYEIGDAQKMMTLLREATTQGVRVHALAGDPAHVLPQNHDKVLARVDARAGGQVTACN